MNLNLMVRRFAVKKAPHLSLQNCGFSRQLTSFVVLSALFALGTAVSQPWLILPGGGSGAITVSTTRRNLADSYGKANVVDGDIDVGEGETEPGTVLFPQDPQRLIDILWKDPKTQLSPKSLTIHGKSSLWKTVHEISLGTSLRHLERINGRPFVLAGWGWDYSGTVTSWKNGVLQSEFEGNGRVILRLDSEEHARDLSKVQGDRAFSSSHPAIQTANPRIYEIIWVFP